MSIRIEKMRTRGVTGKVKAYFTLILNELVVDDMRLIDGKNGFFVGFPSKKYTKKSGEEAFVDLIKPARDSEGKFTAGADKLVKEITKLAIAEFSRRSGEDVENTDEGDDDLPF